MKTPLEEVIEEIKAREISPKATPAVNQLVSELEQHCKGLTPCEIEAWLNNRQKRAVREFMVQVTSFETMVNSLASKMSVR
jgi:hypothetical protein